MEKSDAALFIEKGEAVLGLELGSTRIKAVLIDSYCNVLASGQFEWENSLIDGIWTYSLEQVRTGVQSTYNSLKKDVLLKYSVKLTKLKAMGVSAMMHGYLAFDENNKQLAQFRTWRNTVTALEARELTELFSFNIPQRWSIAHLLRAINGEEAHVSKISRLTTLAGYVLFLLCGKWVLGVGDASGMFPIDSSTGTYNEKMLALFDEKIKDKNLPWKLCEILPEVLSAGQCAGVLTKEGAAFLDSEGDLLPGALLSPPEGDAGTGMAATNSVCERTGNVSAGTSIFAMAVLEKPLKGVYEEVDIVATPDGRDVAMVHCNNCTGDLDAWVKMFCSFSSLMDSEVEKSRAYDKLYNAALQADADCGGVVTFNNLSGEPVTGLEAGIPLVIRSAQSKFTLPNFFRSLIYSTMSALKIGMDILFEKENVRLDKLYGHGGLFKTPVVAQRFLASALNTPVAVMETAGEGGPWGCALLAKFAAENEGEALSDFLSNKVFLTAKQSVEQPNEKDTAGFGRYMENYKRLLCVEREAVESEG